MQEQAFLTEQLWLSTPNLSRGIIQDIWKGNYMVTQQNIQKAVSLLLCTPGSDTSISLLEKISQNISELTQKKQAMESLFFIESSAVHYH
jgi:hypothetical protein